MGRIHCIRSLVLMCLAVFAAIAVSLAEPMQPNETIEGNWLGKLGEIRVVFRITKNEGGSFTAFMDSPDQLAFDIPVNRIVFENGNVRLETESIGCLFEGEVHQDSIDGALKPLAGGGESVPLVLKRVDEVPVPPRRPQTPKKPYPYEEEEVVYENKAAGIKLAGTLTLPPSEGPFSAVLLIAGSGPQDRDETLLHHKPFLVLADHLTRCGIAVLRIDKRGVGESTGDFGQATCVDFASDALAGVEYLKSRKEIHPKYIGLIGHSQGGQVAYMAATQSQDVAFIVMMAGTGINGYDNMILQDVMSARESGATDEEIALIRPWCERFYAIAVEEKDDALARKKMQDLYAARTEEEEHAFRFLHGITLQIDYAVSPGMRYSLAFDPAPFLRKVKCPVLAINGERDVQVPPKQNLRGIEEALKAGGNRNYTVKELPNLNHLFQTVEPGGETDYGKIEETMSPAVLKMIADWISEQTDVKKVDQLLDE